MESWKILIGAEYKGFILAEKRGPLQEYGAFERVGREEVELVAVGRSLPELIDSIASLNRDEEDIP